MSKTVRIALVAEGITDYVVLKATVESMLDGTSFDIKLLQPEGSVAFAGAGSAGPLGGGWTGVYRWCLQAAERGGGNLRNDPLFAAYDVLILHLDADVASENPANHQNDIIRRLADVLPCEKPCPPPEATTNRLRQVLLSWIGERKTPPQTVLCTPSKSIEAWVIAIFFPHDRQMTKLGWECHPDPASRLAQQPKKTRFAKSHADYQVRHIDIQREWPRIVRRFSEAKRFRDEFASAAGLGVAII